MQRLLLCVATALPLAAQSARADDDLVLGNKLHVDNCLRCHGAKGGGGVGKRLAGDAAYWDFPSSSGLSWKASTTRTST